MKIVHHGHPIGRRTLIVRARGTRTVGVALASSALHELRAGNISAGLRVTFVDADGARVTRPFGLRLKRG